MAKKTGGYDLEYLNKLAKTGAEATLYRSEKKSLRLMNVFHPFARKLPF